MRYYPMLLIFLLLSSWLCGQPGTIDTTFNVADGQIGVYGVDGEINDMVQQPDGKIIIGGKFETLDGIPKRNIARLLSDGSLDVDFNSGLGFNGPVLALGLQDDGGIIVAGEFSIFNKDTINNIVRLKPDGSLDRSFYQVSGDMTVHAMIIQPNGKILIGGDLGTVDHLATSNLVRLNRNGTIDTAFVNQVDIYVYALALDSDGNILFGGENDHLPPHATNVLWSVDTSGHLSQPIAPFTDVIKNIAVQPDGKILVSSRYAYNLGGNNGSEISRIWPDGTEDITFRIDRSIIDPGTISLQPDGKILVGSRSYPRELVSRYNQDGSKDSSFKILETTNLAKRIMVNDDHILVGAREGSVVKLALDGSLIDTFAKGWGFNDQVDKIVVQQDDKLVVSGDFTHFNRRPALFLCRLNKDGALDTSFVNQLPLKQPPKCFAVGSDGSIIVADNKVNSNSKSYLVRLFPDGSMDPNFNFTSDNFGLLNLEIHTVAVQPDGRIILALYNRLLRLQPDGSIEADIILSDDPTTFENISIIKFQSDGKIIVTGKFKIVKDRTINNMFRLNVDFTLDNTFDYQGEGNILCLEIQEDDKILLGGNSHRLDKVFYGAVARLLPNGQSDPSFKLKGKSGLPNLVNNLVIQSDGKVVLSYLDFITNGPIYRFLPDGTYDDNFYIKTKPNGGVCSLNIQSDGKIVAGGRFTRYQEVPQNKIVRLQNCMDGVRIDKHAACRSFTWINGITYTASNTTDRYVFEEKSVLGCDSVAILNLKIYSDLDKNVVLHDNGDAGYFIYARESDALYQWIDCDSGLPIEGATSRAFYPIKSGRYAVIVSSPYCDDVSVTSQCIEVYVVNTQDEQMSSLVLYPNPTTGIVNIEGIAENIQSIAVHAVSGQVLQSHHGPIVEINLSGLADGLYFLTIQYGDAIVTRKIALKKD
ncbi:MAG: T9SS type A sorting domain-containing protein [Chitinophagales bacterium]|nr:T9SS type A sorting domain-containing protein [Chitinophagales bacterium]